MLFSRAHYLLLTILCHRQETYNDPDLDALSNKPLSFGEQLDGKGSPKQNKGFFEKALLKATENDLGGREVKAVANGHSHRAYFSFRIFLALYLVFNSHKLLPSRTRDMVLFQRWLIIQWIWTSRNRQTV